MTRSGVRLMEAFDMPNLSAYTRAASKNNLLPLLSSHAFNPNTSKKFVNFITVLCWFNRILK